MNSSASRILIAGVGNVLYGDDAFGSEVARRLAEQSLPDNVRAIDFGIRGFDLVAALLDPYDVVIIVDSLSQSEHPGALRVFDSRRDLTIQSLPPGCRPQWHSIDPATALNMAHSLGGNLGRVILVGCEPSRSARTGCSPDRNDRACTGRRQRRGWSHPRAGRSAQQTRRVVPASWQRVIASEPGGDRLTGRVGVAAYLAVLPDPRLESLDASGELGPCHLRFRDERCSDPRRIGPRSGNDASQGRRTAGP